MGVVPTQPTIYEVLEELAITVQVWVGVGVEEGPARGVIWCTCEVCGMCTGRAGQFAGQALTKCWGLTSVMQCQGPGNQCAPALGKSPALSRPTPCRLSHHPTGIHPCCLQNQLQAELPFCAFNGGNDVFVDVGNKSLGLEALMNHLGFTPAEVGTPRGSAALDIRLDRSACGVDEEGR